MTSKITRTRKPALTLEGEPYAPPGEHLSFVKETPPAAGRAIALREGLRWLRMPLPMALNHINLWLLEVPDGWVLVDTGLATDATRELWVSQERELLQGKPIRLIVVTHFHPDHAGLVGWLQRRHGAPVWMSRDSFQVLQDWATRDGPQASAASLQYFMSHGVADAADLEVISKAAGGRADMIDTLPTVERFLEDGDTVRWNGVDWSVLLTHGHATGHLCFASAAAGAIISGDQILPRISPNVSLYAHAKDANPLASYLSSLERLRKLAAPLLVLPSHGIPFHGLAERAAALEAHHADQLRKLRIACAEEARSADELLVVMYRRPLRAFDKMLGIGEAVAHLEYLVAGGIVARSVDLEGRVRYRTRLNPTPG